MKDKYFTIGKIEKFAGTSVKTIRYYHDIGILPATEVSPTGRRYYSINEVWYLQLILTLRHMGFCLADIRKIISEGDVLKSIELQIKLIKSQIEHQNKILAILQQALESGSNENALQYIHDIGREVRMDRDGRKLLLNRIEFALVETDVPEDWKNQMLEPFLAFIGSNPTEEQLAARNELLTSNPCDRVGERGRHVSERSGHTNVCRTVCGTTQKYDYGIISSILGANICRQPH